MMPLSRCPVATPAVVRHHAERGASPLLVIVALAIIVLLGWFVFAPTTANPAPESPPIPVLTDDAATPDSAVLDTTSRDSLRRPVGDPGMTPRPDVSIPRSDGALGRPQPEPSRS